MSDQTPTSVLVAGRAPDGDNAVQGALVWVLGSLAAAFAIFTITLMISNQNEREAGRMIVGAQKASGYLPTVTAQFATMHGRPGGL